MLSKPFASGVMLTAIIVLGGGALLQSDSADDAARTAVVTEPEATPERTATAPTRVVDSAGFPVVPESETQETVEPTGPMVTVNGRPLNGDRSTTSVQTQPAPEAVATTPAVKAPEAPTQAQETVAINEPPRPIPRPEGLSVPRVQQPQSQPAIDYDAIAAIAYGQDETVIEPPMVGNSGEFMSLEQRRQLAPLTGEVPYPPASVPDRAPYDPSQDGLVAVVGPDGEPIWIYEDQVRGNATTNSGVTFQTRRVQSNPFGFVYEDFGW